MTNKKSAMDAIRAAEDAANKCRVELLELNMENNQLLHDYNKVYDVITGIRNRIKAVKYWGDDPVLILAEIEDMLANVVE